MKYFSRGYKIIINKYSSIYRLDLITNKLRKFSKYMSVKVEKMAREMNLIPS